MDVLQFFNSVGQLGLGGIVFVIWYSDSKKIDGYKDMVTKLADLVQAARDERSALVKMVAEQSRVIERTAGILARVEKKLP